MSIERKEFSKRLRAAMQAKGWEDRPAELERRFNMRSARSVTFQTASAWLGGRSIPRQEKLRTLAALLGVEPQFLHYGGKEAHAVREPSVAWPPGIDAQDKSAIGGLLSLSAPHRKLVRELIAALSKVN